VVDWIKQFGYDLSLVKFDEWKTALEQKILKNDLMYPLKQTFLEATKYNRERPSVVSGNSSLLVQYSAFLELQGFPPWNARIVPHWHEQQTMSYWMAFTLANSCLSYIWHTLLLNTGYHQPPIQIDVWLDPFVNINIEHRRYRHSRAYRLIWHSNRVVLYVKIVLFSSLCLFSLLVVTF